MFPREGEGRSGERLATRGEKFFSNETVSEHYRHPRNVGSLDRNDPAVGSATVGTPARGVMKLQVRIAPDRVVAEARFKVFGCVHTIACSSWTTSWIEGKTIAEALDLTPERIAIALELPAEKVPCADLPVQAIRAAVEEYEARVRG